MCAPCILLGIVYYLDPERLIFFHNIGFFMVVVDAGQLFSCWLTIACPLFENHLAEVVRSKPGRRIYGENATYPPILAFLGLFAYPTPRG